LGELIGTAEERMARILVIDDDKATRELIQRILAKAGHEVSLAGNGREGLERLIEVRPAIVITDVFMPDKDGVETIIALKKAHPGIKIIAMSGGGRVGNLDFLQLAERVGADKVLQKPIRMAALLEGVTQLAAPD
jgi:CheY-like chemotaxis protein